MTETAQHFPGCHPEDSRAPDSPPAGHGVPGGGEQETEPCWHCATPTTRGCNCSECWEGADYVPPSAAYHCKTCGRWWAWMTGLNITTISWEGDDPEPRYEPESTKWGGEDEGA